MKQIGDRLKDLREARDLRQNEVAAALNISNKLLSSYERNVSVPPAETIKKLCEYYNASADFLLQIEINQPMDVPDTTDQPGYNLIALTPQQKRVLTYYNRLNDENQEAVRGLITLLLKEQHYRKK
jgi:transcriptional regulator with XRE-family HTH domain